MSKFSDTLIYLRKREGLSQQELANKMGTSRSIVGMYEAGQRMPSFEMLEALADIFNVNLDFLIGRESGGVQSQHFRKKLAQIVEASDPAELESAGVDMYEVGLIIKGAIPLSFDTACNLAEQFGETLDSMISEEEKPAPDSESGLDMEIMNILLSLRDDKKAEAVNYLRYLSKREDI